MRDKWDNLFWFERVDSGDGKEQLENNTTKGFLKVLQESDDRITTQFLERATGLDPGEDIASIEYGVQVNIDDIPSDSVDVKLLGLSYRGENVARENQPRSGEGTIDGIISLHTEAVTTTVAIEVKTGNDSLKPKQMGKYRGKLGVDADHCHGFSWLRVYELFEQHLENEIDPKDRFLLSEFTEYLVLMNMVPFKGFDRDALAGPGSKEYKQSHMRVTLNRQGTFVQSMEERFDEYGFGDFHAVSNQANDKVHLIEDRDTGFQHQGHFSAGFWIQGKFNVQLYLPNRIRSTVTQWGKAELSPEFESVLRSCLSDLKDITLTNPNNPVVFVRYQRNIQQAHDRARQTSTFYADSVFFAPDLGEEALANRLELIGRSVHDANYGNEKSLVIEKQIPYTSEFIDDEDLPDYTLEYFQALSPIYELFQQ